MTAARCVPPRAGSSSVVPARLQAWVVWPGWDWISRRCGRPCPAAHDPGGTRGPERICPYCAVGCGQIVSVRDGQIVNIEGNPDSPINRGTLYPKGSAAF